MNSRPAHTLKSLLHPCIFVLKEGGKIKKDFLDYSLMILFTHSREVVRSPISLQSQEDSETVKKINME